MRPEQTFENGLNRSHVLQAIHGSPESGKTQFIAWSLEPGPYFFLDVVCFVKGSLVWFVRMSKLRVEKGLGQIAGTLETLIETIDHIRIQHCTRVE